MLIFLVNELRNDWDDYLFYVFMVYKVMIYDSIYCFFNLLMIGREMNLLIDVMIGILNMFFCLINMKNGLNL